MPGSGVKWLMHNRVLADKSVKQCHQHCRAEYIANTSGSHCLKPATLCRHLYNLRLNVALWRASDRFLDSRFAPKMVNIAEYLELR
jgi:hypothetical protein